MIKKLFFFIIILNIIDARYLYDEKSNLQFYNLHFLEKKICPDILLNGEIDFNNKWNIRIYSDVEKSYWLNRWIKREFPNYTIYNTPQCQLNNLHFIYNNNINYFKDTMFTLTIIEKLGINTTHCIISFGQDNCIKRFFNDLLNHFQLKNIRLIE